MTHYHYEKHIKPIFGDTELSRHYTYSSLKNSNGHSRTA